MDTKPRLLVALREAAEMLGFSEKFIWNNTVPRGDIPCIRFGKSVRYSVAALEEWIRNRMEAGDV